LLVEQAARPAAEAAHVFPFGCSSALSGAGWTHDRPQTFGRQQTTGRTRPPGRTPRSHTSHAPTISGDTTAARKNERLERRMASTLLRATQTSRITQSRLPLAGTGGER
jgi:hypothetical protein